MDNSFYTFVSTFLNLVFIVFVILGAASVIFGLLSLTGHLQFKRTKHLRKILGVRLLSIFLILSGFEIINGSMLILFNGLWLNTHYLISSLFILLSCILLSLEIIVGWPKLGFPYIPNTQNRKILHAGLLIFLGITNLFYMNERYFEIPRSIGRLLFIAVFGSILMLSILWYNVRNQAKQAEIEL